MISKLAGIKEKLCLSSNCQDILCKLQAPAEPHLLSLLDF